MNQRTQFILSGITISFVIVLLGAINLAGFVLIRHKELRVQEQITRVQYHLDTTNRIQINFKTQVQEWKNILLRGHIKGDQEKYFSQFEARERNVFDDLQNLADSEDVPRQYREKALAVLTLLKENGEIYRESLKSYPLSKLENSFLVDDSVRGIDRAPMFMLNSLNESFSAAQRNLRRQSEEDLRSTVNFLISMSAICLVGGIFITVAFLVDRRRFEAALSVAKTSADNANKAKSKFLAHMSHEIRTPMNGITATMDLLKDTEMPDELRESIEVIESSAESLTVIVNDILDLSKIEAGQLKLDPEEIPLDKFLKVLKKTLEPVAKKKSLGLEFEVPACVSALSVQVDPIRLRQVLLNLMSNAIKFTDTGSVRLVVDCLDCVSEDYAKIRFSIIDTGIGIPHEKQLMLFKAFSQVDASATRRFKGTGLGLAICKAIVESMNGSIGMTSEENKGSTFYFTLDLEIAKRIESKVPENVIEAEIGLPPLNAILLVDDVATNLLVASKLLQKMGLTVDKAKNGQEAIECALKRNYDLILMDCQMPVMDGYQASKIIRSTHEHQPVIVAMTAHAMDDHKDQSIQAGMDAHISKPIRKQSIEGTLSQYFDLTCNKKEQELCAS